MFPVPSQLHSLLSAQPLPSDEVGRGRGPSASEAGGSSSKYSPPEWEGLVWQDFGHAVRHVYPRDVITEPCLQIS
jgi:hypothetical protein